MSDENVSTTRERSSKKRKVGTSAFVVPEEREREREREKEKRGKNWVGEGNWKIGSSDEVEKRGWDEFLLPKKLHVLRFEEKKKVAETLPNSCDITKADLPLLSINYQLTAR